MRQGTDRHAPRPRRWFMAPALAGLVLSLPIAQGVAAASGAAATSAPASAEALNFRVYLDQDPIGEHRFQVAPGPGGHQVVSRASFDVKLWIFNAYRYRHESRETWRNGCLEQIRSTTDDNGKSYQVDGEQETNALAVRVNGDRKNLPACVSTFAYWDRNFLKQQRLLNPQTGELVAVRVVPAGTEQRMFNGREVAVERYRLRTDRLDISLWYTPDGRWIGLESDTGQGRMLRYERI